MRLLPFLTLATAAVIMWGSDWTGAHGEITTPETEIAALPRDPSIEPERLLDWTLDGPVAAAEDPFTEDFREFLPTGAIAAKAVSPEDHYCMALNIYFEARSEAYIGQMAVAGVTLNRVNHPKYPDTVCGVIRHGGEWPMHRCQFSWWCDGKSDRPRDLTAWRQSQAAAWMVLAGLVEDPTEGALYYHADYVSPSWSKKMRRVAQIGRHVYYHPPR